MKTRVVIVNIAANAELLNEPERFCSEARLASSAGIRDEAKRMQGIAAELALSYAVSGEALIKPAYSYAENGKPVCENGFISLSHTEGYAAAVLSPLPCGIDIEAERPVSPAAASRMLCPAEKTAMDKSGESYALSRFVMKEAFLKMTGAGVFGGMDRVYETEGRVFFGGVLRGYSKCFDGPGYFCHIVTRSEPVETELILL